jgi:hypothetical protein
LIAPYKLAVFRRPYSFFLDMAEPGGVPSPAFLTFRGQRQTLSHLETESRRNFIYYTGTIVGQGWTKRQRRAGVRQKLKSAGLPDVTTAVFTHNPAFFFPRGGSVAAGVVYSGRWVVRSNAAENSPKNWEGRIT